MHSKSASVLVAGAARNLMHLAKGDCDADCVWLLACDLVNNCIALSPYRIAL